MMPINDTLLFFLVLLFIPLTLRILIFLKEPKFSILIGEILGTSQDILIIYQLSFLFYFCNTLFAKILIYPLFLLLSLYYLIDYFYFRYTQVRFHISYCRHLTHPKSFISSAKEFGLISFFNGICNPSYS